jgi:hypothetical protein
MIISAGVNFHSRKIVPTNAAAIRKSRMKVDESISIFTFTLLPP